SHLRIFDSSGKALTDGYFSPTANSPLQLTVQTSGTYYVGVSGYNNIAYDPNQAGSGLNGSNVGNYNLTLERRSAPSTTLTQVVATAARGTPAQAGLASANTGQTITLLGNGLRSDDKVVFTAINSSAGLSNETIAPTSVAP